MFDRPPMGHPHPLLHPAALHHFRPPLLSSGHPADALLHHNLHHQQQQQQAASAGGSTNTTINKPRIWSLADMASKESSSPSNGSKDEPGNPGHNSNSQSSPGNHLHNGRPYSPSGGGKIVSPLAGRLPIHGSPYVRPEFYRNFYPQGAPTSNGNMSAEAALLESYQRTFGGLGPNGLSMHHPLNSMLHKVTAAGPHHFSPLSLTTAVAAHNHANASSNSHQGANQGGVSPSASSTSSIADNPVNTVPVSGDSKCSNSNGSNASSAASVVRGEVVAIKP